MLASAAASSSSASSGSRAPALAGVDLSLLTAAIAPPDALAEPDEVWQFDRILQQLTQEMVAEQERQEAEAAGAGPLSPKGA